MISFFVNALNSVVNINDRENYAMKIPDHLTNNYIYTELMIQIT